MSQGSRNSQEKLIKKTERMVRGSNGLAIVAKSTKENLQTTKKV